MSTCVGVGGLASALTKARERGYGPPDLLKGGQRVSPQ